MTPIVMPSDAEIQAMAARVGAPPCIVPADVILQTTIDTVKAYVGFGNGWNTQLQKIYDNAYAIFDQDFRLGYVTADKLPVPPNAYELDMSGAGVNFKIGTTPVCPQRPLPDLSGPPEGTVDIDWSTRQVTYNHGTREIWLTAGLHDRNHDYEKPTTPMKGDPDGQWHTYMHVPNAVGNGWYLQVS
jgi:hypothetical protein